jgi:type III secretory pathway component EscS
VIKLAAIVVTMLVCARWTCNELIQLINLAFELMPAVGR